MADRPEVKTASPIGTASTLTELGTRLAGTLATRPLHQPWRGPEASVVNVAYPAPANAHSEVRKRVLSANMRPKKEKESEK